MRGMWLPPRAQRLKKTSSATAHDVVLLGASLGQHTPRQILLGLHLRAPRPPERLRRPDAVAAGADGRRQAGLVRHGVVQHDVEHAHLARGVRVRPRNQRHAASTRDLDDPVEAGRIDVHRCHVHRVRAELVQAETDHRLPPERVRQHGEGARLAGEPAQLAHRLRPRLRDLLGRPADDEHVVRADGHLGAAQDEEAGELLLKGRLLAARQHVVMVGDDEAVQAVRDAGPDHVRRGRPAVGVLLSVDVQVDAHAGPLRVAEDEGDAGPLYGRQRSLSTTRARKPYAFRP